MGCASCRTELGRMRSFGAWRFLTRASVGPKTVSLVSVVSFLITYADKKIRLLQIWILMDQNKLIKLIKLTAIRPGAAPRERANDRDLAPGAHCETAEWLARLLLLPEAHTMVALCRIAAMSTEHTLAPSALVL